jgi:hypothetical protein
LTVNGGRKKPSQKGLTISGNKLEQGTITRNLSCIYLKGIVLADETVRLKILSGGSSCLRDISASALFLKGLGHSTNY